MIEAPSPWLRVALNWGPGEASLRDPSAIDPRACADACTADGSECHRTGCMHCSASKLMLPEAIAEEVRRIARQAALQFVQAHGFTRAEMLDMLADLTPPLKPEDAAVLKVLLPWLAHHRSGTQVLAKEIIALMTADQAGGEVRTALAAELRMPYPAKALGRLLRRCAWRPVEGFYIKVTLPSHPRESALFTCVACT